VNDAADLYDRIEQEPAMPSKDAGRVARLFVLGTLGSAGPVHGHEIRRLAERNDVENWSDAQVGPIYNAIRCLEAELRWHEELRDALAGQ
jgi:hypothetical protein